MTVSIVSQFDNSVVIDASLLDRNCRSLFSKNEIKFSGIINNMGRLIAGGFRVGMNRFEGVDFQKMFIETALRVSMRKDYDHNLGPVSYSASRRKNTIVMSFPMGDNTLLILAEPSIGIEDLARLVAESFKI